jgi:hypothetical protein
MQFRNRKIKTKRNNKNKIDLLLSSFLNLHSIELHCTALSYASLYTSSIT